MEQDLGNRAGMTQKKVERDGVEEKKREREGRETVPLLNPLVREDLHSGEKWRERNGEDDPSYFKGQGRIMQRKKRFSCTFQK